MFAKYPSMDKYYDNWGKSMTPLEKKYCDFVFNRCRHAQEVCIGLETIGVNFAAKVFKPEIFGDRKELAVALTLFQSDLVVTASTFQNFILKPLILRDGLPLATVELPLRTVAALPLSTKWMDPAFDVALQPGQAPDWAVVIWCALQDAYNACRSLHHELFYGYVCHPVLATKVFDCVANAMGLISRRICIDGLAVAALGEERVAKLWGIDIRRGEDGEVLANEEVSALSVIVSAARADDRAAAAVKCGIGAGAGLAAAGAADLAAGAGAMAMEAEAAAVDAADLAAADAMEAEAAAGAAAVDAADLAAADAMEAEAMSAKALAADDAGATGAVDAGASSCGESKLKRRACDVGLLAVKDPATMTPGERHFESKRLKVIELLETCKTPKEERAAFDFIDNTFEEARELDRAAGVDSPFTRPVDMPKKAQRVVASTSSAAAAEAGAAASVEGCADASAAILGADGDGEKMKIDDNDGAQCGDAAVLIDNTPVAPAIDYSVGPSPAPISAVPSVDCVFNGLTEKQWKIVCDVKQYVDTLAKINYYQPREIKPIKFLAPSCDPAEGPVEEVDQLWCEECQKGRQEGVPDLVVYGNLKPTEDFEGTVFCGRVRNPVTGEYEVHYFFSKQGPSNFGDFGGQPLHFRDANGGVTPLHVSTAEGGFQFAKATTVKTREGRQAMFNVLMGRKPLDAKKATGRGKLNGVSDAWNLNSAEVMRRFVFANLANPSYFKLLASSVAFSASVLGVPSERVYWHEGTDDSVYGVNIREGENPLKDRATFGPGGAHCWKGGDVLGKALTEAARLTGEFLSHEEFMASEEFKPKPIVFAVAPDVEDEEASEEEVRAEYVF